MDNMMMDERFANLMDQMRKDDRMSGMMDDLMQDMPSMPTLPRLRRHNLNMSPHMSSMPNLAEQERFESPFERPQPQRMSTTSNARVVPVQFLGSQAPPPKPSSPPTSQHFNTLHPGGYHSQQGSRQPSPAPQRQPSPAPLRHPSPAPQRHHSPPSAHQQAQVSPQPQQVQNQQPQKTQAQVEPQTQSQNQAQAQPRPQAQVEAQQAGSPVTAPPARMVSNSENRTPTLGMARRQASIDDFSEQIVNMLDDVERRVEQFRETASQLEQEKDAILEMLNGVNLNTEIMMLGEGEREDINAITNRLLARTKTVDVLVNTPRNSEQAKALDSVNQLIDVVLNKVQEDLNNGKDTNQNEELTAVLNTCRRYLNACSPDQPEGPIDQRFQSVVIECTADDQKKIRRKLASIIQQIERAERAAFPQY